MAEPLHERIYQDLLKKIRSHEYDEGMLLPTELEMESIYQVSKAPIRQALSRLNKEGFIIRRAGKGTFVAGRKSWPYSNMGGSEQELITKGPFLHCVTMKVAKETLPDDVAELIKLTAGTETLGVERVRYYKEKPINYLYHYIFGVDQETIVKEGNFSSLLAIYDRLGIKISRTEDVIEAVAANGAVAKNLDIKSGTPLLLINRSTYNENGELLEFVKFYILTKEWKYRAKYVNEAL